MPRSFQDSTISTPAGTISEIIGGGNRGFNISDEALARLAALNELGNSNRLDKKARREQRKFRRQRRRDRARDRRRQGIAPRVPLDEAGIVRRDERRSEASTILNDSNISGDNAERLKTIAAKMAVRFAERRGITDLSAFLSLVDFEGLSNLTPGEGFREALRQSFRFAKRTLEQADDNAGDGVVIDPDTGKVSTSTKDPAISRKTPDTKVGGFVPDPSVLAGPPITDDDDLQDDEEDALDDDIDDADDILDDEDDIIDSPVTTLRPRIGRFNTAIGLRRPLGLLEGF